MADVRTLKVLSVDFNREWQPQGKDFKIYYFSIKWEEDNIIGEFSTNARNQVKFLVGETYEVKIETKSSGRGSYLFFDYSDSEKEKRKESYGNQKQSKGGSYKYVRSREEVLLIISQSSYDVAVIAADKISKEIKLDPPISSHEQLSEISKKFCEYVIATSGLGSPECKSDNKEALKAANDKSIVCQKALKIAVECLEIETMTLPDNPDPKVLRTTRGIIALADVIVKDIINIANGL